MHDSSLTTRHKATTLLNGRLVDLCLIGTWRYWNLNISSLPVACPPFPDFHLFHLHPLPLLLFHSLGIYETNSHSANKSTYVGVLPCFYPSGTRGTIFWWSLDGNSHAFGKLVQMDQTSFAGSRSLWQQSTATSADINDQLLKRFTHAQLAAWYLPKWVEDGRAHSSGYGFSSSHMGL